MILQGYRVVELGTHIAAPATAALLGDWGAEIVKIEAARGDPIRWQRPPAKPGGSSPIFEADNRGKRSIILDYKLPEGRAILGRLLSRADVFVTSIRPGALRRARLDHTALLEDHPRLVYTSITGYGLAGEAVDTPAFDITAFWSRSGLGGQMWPAGFPPLNWRPGTGDHITALGAAFGTVLALLDRTRTGKGRLVETSLLRAGTYTGTYDLAEQLRQGKTPPALPRGAPGAPVSNYFRTSDEHWICLWAHDPVADWPKIFAAAKRPELAADRRFATQEARIAHGDALTAALDPAFAAMARAEAGARLSTAGIVWGPVQKADAVVIDPLAAAAGCFVQVGNNSEDGFRAPAGPVRMGDSDAPKRLPPRLGEHTDAVLAELGYAAEDISQLRQRGAVS